MQGKDELKEMVPKPPKPSDVPPFGEVVRNRSVLMDSWLRGPAIGRGGFSKVYAAFREGSSNHDQDREQYVMKIAPINSRRLLLETTFFLHVGSPILRNAWLEAMKRKYLGIPRYVSIGTHQSSNGALYRFLVMERLGLDLQKCLRAAGGRFCSDTICHVALGILEALTYIHVCGYAHADLKANNIVTGTGTQAHRIYIIDFNLSKRYVDRNWVPLPYIQSRSQRAGTPLYLSIDAHDGINPSRRGDLETLGYCLLEWACGSLPWKSLEEGKTSYCASVAQRKKEYKENVPKLLHDCFGADSSQYQYLEAYMVEVLKLGYTEKPNYLRLMKFFEEQLNGRAPTMTLEWMTAPSREQRKKRRCLKKLCCCCGRSSSEEGL